MTFLVILLLFMCQPAHALDMRDEAELGTRFAVSSGSTTINSTAEVDALLLLNLSTSTIKVYIDKIYFSSLSSNSKVIVNIYGQPTVTANGTKLTPRNSYFGHASVAKAEVYKSPTISSMGALVAVYSVKDTVMLIDIFEGRVIIPPGYRMLLTVQMDAAGNSFSSTFSWVER